MDYRIWAIVGISLLIAELFTPSFFLVFFGIGGIIAAVTTGTGLTPDASGQLLVFSLSSLALMLLFRQKLKFRSVSADLPPDFIGQRVKVTKTIPCGEEGRVIYRGSEWIAFCGSDDVELPEGSMVEVVGNDGVRLKVKKIG
jgi:membrane protein implicated in regulation of membrane protease activity